MLPRKGLISERCGSADVALSEKSPYLGGDRGKLIQNDSVGEVVLRCALFRKSGVVCWLWASERIALRFCLVMRKIPLRRHFLPN
jgi:hypothetical protein